MNNGMHFVQENQANGNREHLLKRLIRLGFLLYL
jgi:hypothetical protein